MLRLLPSHLAFLPSDALHPGITRPYLLYSERSRKVNLSRSKHPSTPFDSDEDYQVDLQHFDSNRTFTFSKQLRLTHCLPKTRPREHATARLQ